MPTDTEDQPIEVPPTEVGDSIPAPPQRDSDEVPVASDSGIEVAPASAELVVEHTSYTAEILREPEPEPELSPPPPVRCGCQCGACDRGDHRNCSHINPCSQAPGCGCRCGACSSDDHRNCSHINPCKKKAEDAAARPQVLVPLPPVVLGSVTDVEGQKRRKRIEKAAFAGHEKRARETAVVPPPAALAPPAPSAHNVDGTMRVLVTYVDKLEDALCQAVEATDERSVVLLEIAECRERLQYLAERLPLIERVTRLLMQPVDEKEESNASAPIEAGPVTE
jgi:hypothetical protein